jgi:hypothetical protein
MDAHPGASQEDHDAKEYRDRNTPEAPGIARSRATRESRVSIDPSGFQHGVELQQQIQSQAQIDRQHNEIEGTGGSVHHPMQILPNKKGAG